MVSFYCLDRLWLSSWLLLSSLGGLSVLGQSDSIIDVDKACYSLGEDILVFFRNGDALEDDWVGFFSAEEDNASLEENEQAWMWLCGPSCDGDVSVEAGTVQVRDSLPTGRWKAVLAPNTDSPFKAYAVSNTFVVRENCENNGDGLFSVLVLGDEFSPGENILVSFEHANPLGDSFVGIYAASTPSSQLNDDNGILWLWICNKQGSQCVSPPDQGVVDFDSGSTWWGGDTDWPLAPGDYKAYLLREDFTVLATSSVFTVVADEDANPSPSPPSNGDENAVALAALMEARDEIEDIIRNDRDLSPKFLRMIFHDCVGGCDGEFLSQP